MENNTDYLHKNSCNCPICNNGIREELQYAALEVADNVFRILDVEEVAHFDLYKDDDSFKEKIHAEFKKVEPDEEAACVLAYGVLIPQYDSTEVEQYKIYKSLDKFKNYAFGTLRDEKVYLSVYEDYVLYKDEPVYNSHIPCALLITSSLDLSEQRDFGFGHTMFLLFKDIELFANILNRDFIFCIGDIEESYDTADAKNWKKYIKKDKLMEIAKRLF